MDGDPQVDRAIVHLFKSADDIEVIATATDAALELAVRLQPAIALVNVGITRLLHGMEITRTLRQQVPETRVIMLSVYAMFRSQVLAAGACRFLLKNCGLDDLVAAFQLAARGECQSNRAERLDPGEDKRCL